jgi:hypothetical protein
MKSLLFTFFLVSSVVLNAQSLRLTDNGARLKNDTGFGFNKEYLFMDRGRALYDVFEKADEWAMLNQENKMSFQKEAGRLNAYEADLYDTGISQNVSLIITFHGLSDGSFFLLFETKTILGQKEWMRITNVMTLQKLLMALEEPSDKGKVDEIFKD